MENEEEDVLQGDLEDILERLLKGESEDGE